MEIVAATGNAHKLREMRGILGPLGLQVLGPAEVGGIPEVVEDADTFEGNAMKKALSAAQATGRHAMADDSGLEVFSLGGEPGVYSARYAGEDADDATNLQKLLGRLAGAVDREARFVCVVALASPDGVLGTASGEIRGRIIHTPRGENGFGYDPVFVPEGHSQTFAELSEAEKNCMSHRARALQAASDADLFSCLKG